MSNVKISRSAWHGRDEWDGWLAMLSGVTPAPLPAPGRPIIGRDSRRHSLPGVLLTAAWAVAA
jgi:hypothetical protein